MKNEPNNEILRKEYKNYIKILDKIIKDAKMKHDKNLMQKKVITLDNYGQLLITMGTKKKEKK